MIYKDIVPSVYQGNVPIWHPNDNELIWKHFPSSLWISTWGGVDTKIIDAFEELSYTK